MGIVMGMVSFVNKNIKIANLDDLSKLESHVIFSDEFEFLPKDRQDEIYAYCRCHAHISCCRENLKMIRYAVTRSYFGY